MDCEMNLAVRARNLISIQQYLLHLEYMCHSLGTAFSPPT